MQKKLLKRSFSIAMTLMLCLSFAMAMVVEVDAASGKTYYLPVRLQNYKQVNGKWKKADDYKYSYDSKGNLTNWAGQPLKLTYKSGKLSKVVVEGSYYKTVKSYNSKGRITKNYFVDDNEENWYLDFRYKYNKKGYISSCKLSTPVNTGTTKYAYKYHKNGLPSQITITVTYADGSKHKEIEKYNKEGMLTSYKHYKNGKLISKLTYKITKSKGRITKVITSGKEDGKKVKFKQVFIYGKKKVSNKKKYISAMGMMMGATLSQTIGDTPIVGYCYWDI